MNVTVYCGASDGNQPAYRQAAMQLGEWIAKNGHTLVYGGGKVGLMGVVADTVLKNGGTVIGVMPNFLVDREISHPGLTVLHQVESMTERKSKMIELGEVFIALPGGPGTLEEITEVVSWGRIGQNNHPCVFFDVNHYYQAVQNMYDTMVNEAFLTQSDRDKILFSDDLVTIESFIANYEAPIVRTY